MLKHPEFVNENDTLKNENENLKKQVRDISVDLNTIKNKYQVPQIVEKEVKVPVDIIVNVPKIRQSINTPIKLISRSIFNDNFVVECCKMKWELEQLNNIPSKTIPLSKDNLKTVSQLKIGIGDKKRKRILKHFNNITSFDELIKMKIGIGVRTVNKLKKYFHIPPIQSPSIINEQVDDSNLPSNIIDDPINDFNLPVDNEPYDKHYLNMLVNSIKNICK
jgi:hypothetical protein